MSKIYVLLPCYNEQENIKILIDKWIHQFNSKELKAKFDYEVVAVNDGSSDCTQNILKNMEKSNKNIKVIEHEQNQGLGKALTTGVSYIEQCALEEDIICTMDADNTHDPRYIHRMLRKMESSGADCIIASRYQKGSKIFGVPAVRNLLSYGARLMYTIFMRIPNVKDYTCGYRIYKMKSIKRAYSHYGDNFINESGFTCMVEILYKLHAVGATFNEVPFELRYDLKKGTSKMKILRNAARSLNIAVNARRKYL